MPKKRALFYAFCENFGLTPREQDRSICRRPKNACRDLGQKVFVPLDSEIAHQHLTGRIVAGIYPLLSDDTCWFLAVDFGKLTWFRPANRFRRRCEEQDLPCYVERSRSGNRAHVWIFFSEPVPARDARALGTSVLSHSAMEEYSIALPLQRTARDTGNSVFIDDEGHLSFELSCWAMSNWSVPCWRRERILKRPIIKGIPPWHMPTERTVVR